MQLIEATTVQYVRCIKPNSHSSPDEFELSLVAEQLRSAGVLDAIRMSREGYPNRLPHKLVLARFGRLAHSNYSRQMKHIDPAAEKQANVPKNAGDSSVESNRNHLSDEARGGKLKTAGIRVECNVEQSSEERDKKACCDLLELLLVQRPAMVFVFVGGRESWGACISSTYAWDE